MSITDLWDDAVPITEMTNTDFDAGRNVTLAISVQDPIVHRELATVTQVQEIDTPSEAMDRAARIELAHAIDTYRVSFAREDFDIAVLLPPTGWVESMPVYDVPLVNADATLTDGRQVYGNTAPPIDSMIEQAVAEGAYDQKSTVVKQGIRRQLGRLE